MPETINSIEMNPKECEENLFSARVLRPKTNRIFFEDCLNKICFGLQRQLNRIAAITEKNFKTIYHRFQFRM